MNAPLDPQVRAHLERAIAEVTLDDKFTQQGGRVFMSGTQALVRLLMLQRERDRLAGLNTAGFVSGYRGSPLGSVDQTLWKARQHLARHQIEFRPGLNEDLAATAIWGTQQVGLRGTAKVDGVFSMWYGKGPGVDRCGDVFKHGNAAGTARHGGVLVIAGDDHGAKSSTLAHQSEHILKACGIPVLYPSTVQEYLDLGIHGWAMSRWSGLWVSMKAVTDVVESSASVSIDPQRVQIALPQDFDYPHADPNGLNIRWPDTPLEQEARLLNLKWYAALAYIRSHRLNHTVIDSSNAWFGIITAGKAYLDTMQALDTLGLDREACEQLGIRVFKCGCVWPLEAVTVQQFAAGLDEILVVEEKRQLIEYQLKEELYNLPDGRRPRIYGKFDEKDGRGGEWAMPQGEWLLPGLGELSPALIARAIAARLLNPGQHASRFGGALPEHIRRRIEERLEILQARDRMLAAPRAVAQRQPTFCSGCPHNTSTHVPEGSRAMAGIGCHYMAVWKPDRNTATFTQMGGEGTPWIGQAPFVTEQHIFANLGDGTYFHSGLLAIRASIAAGVNITYKVLYNDAVAMTGGQPVDGTLTVPMIVEQVRGEGARRIDIVTDEPQKYEDWKDSQELRGVRIHHRDHLDVVQRELRDVPGCTVLIYDQTCASEKRRRRKKIVNGVPAFPDPPRRVFINTRVCEGCGDCTVQSSCLSVEPAETPYGRKRQINQSSCNKDFSCLKGFCPSFVTIEGGSLRKGTRTAAAVPQTWPAALREPADPESPAPGQSGKAVYGILVTGIGGTGVVTVGQILGMAAHLEGRGVSVLDMAGLAQKGGAVLSHVQIAAEPSALHATRIDTGEADLVLGCDLVVSASSESLSRMRPNVTRAVINADVAPTADFMSQRDWSLPADRLRQSIVDAAGAVDVDFVHATELATGLMGDAIYTNPLVLGLSYQKGWLPLSRMALERAIELNGQQVERNLEAFTWGRRIAIDPRQVALFAGIEQGASASPRAGGATVVELRRNPAGERVTQEPGALIQQRADELVRYQGSRLARRYTALVERVRTAEALMDSAPAAGAAALAVASSAAGSSAAASSAHASSAAAASAAGGAGLLTESVARNYFKLLAYKDEYEVARLHSDPEFLAAIEARFEGDYRIVHHLAPPILDERDKVSGEPVKRAFGPWMRKAFSALQHLKFLRGTPLDPFGRLQDRRQERQLIEWYEQDIEALLAQPLEARSRSAALALTRWPDAVRGYGHVKAKSIQQAEAARAGLLAALRSPPADERRSA